jgi:hypothetical protein
MSEEPKKTHYELPTGAVAILEETLVAPTWYKDEPKAGMLMTRANAAYKALPDTAPRPKPEKGEDPEDYNARVDAWAAVLLEFDWTEKQKDAAKTCIRYFIKQGALDGKDPAIALIHLLGLDDE